ncbi:MAG: hypothetical protein ACXWZL_10360 [Mycobacterium sp.]
MIPEQHRPPGDHTETPTPSRDVWKVLAQARTEQAYRTLAAAQDAVFQRYLPMARALANAQCADRGMVDPVQAAQAAEIGLAKAVLGWRRPDDQGFESFAGIAISAQLDRLPGQNPASTPDRRESVFGGAEDWSPHLDLSTTSENHAQK